uniref:ATP synthase F0 subunit 6 n=1 Tax=Coptosoma variegatum TaxID=2968960 RepID=UPI0022377F35|nr:ATP synthase F0 subunit 6 [Coptosoma variegatum]UYA97854.1 ATP synthase F0 subunit 6 [Coptosoma variegatum]
MMTNLFSTFDPATTTSMSMNWSSAMLSLIIAPMLYWTLPNRSQMMMSLISKKLHEEFKLLLGKNSKGMTLMMMSLLLFIMLNNLMGLLPYVFTSSSHLNMSMTMAIPFWLGIMIYGWINHTNHMFAHLVPSGTPMMLMPFMVLIETISNLMRPGSLAVRLTANMIAGHLLMSLLGNSAIDNMNLLPIMIAVQMVLMTFEMAVAVIQGYVFSVLSTLYSSEVS